MKFTKKSNALCPNLMSFYFIFMSLTKVKPRNQKPLALIKEKTKQTSQPLLLSTPATPSQQNR
jgi:hypothetical protein